MHKLGFVISYLLSIVGCIFLIIVCLIDKTIPVVGKMLSQLTDTKRYGDLMYQTNYTLVYTISALMIVIGVVLAIYFYRREKVC